MKNALKSNEKRGFINRQGKEVASTSYDEVLPFTDGMTAAYTGSGWQLIDKTGQVLKYLPDSITDAGVLSEGLLPVCTGEKWGYMNMAGDFVVAPRFMQAGNFVDLVEAVGNNH